jgi:hypothetical protein
MERLVKVATPLTAATVAVPPRVAPAAPPWRVRVMLELSEVTMLLLASSTATVTEERFWPATPVVGAEERRGGWGRRRR